MKHLRELNNFSNNGGKMIKESVRLIDDKFLVLKEIEIPKSLVSAYVKKVKDDSGQDIKSFYGDEILAEKIISYITSNLINIDNLPVSIVLGDAQKVQTQPIQVGQPQGQVQGQSQGQPQGQTQGQQQGQTQGQTQGQGQQSAQQTAQEIPAQEGGTQGQKIQNQATQGQTQKVDSDEI
jgi:hypothetical protein